jgi:hypothetical protein
MLGKFKRGNSMKLLFRRIKRSKVSMRKRLISHPKRKIPVCVKRIKE